MPDPLSQALEEAGTVSSPATPGDVAAYPTHGAPPLGPVLEHLRAQLLEAMQLPFFDGETHVETTPVTKHAHAEAGGARIVARRREPAYEATVDLQVRSDHDSPLEPAEPAGYRVALSAHVRCDDDRGASEHAVEVTVREIDGVLRLDIEALRTSMAAAIRAMGSASPDVA